MSSLFDIPAQLAMLLSLAAASAGQQGEAMVTATSEPPRAQVAELLEGPMRFGERAWLQALHENPAQSAGYASRVFVTSGGRFYVPTASDRRQILAARNDTQLAAQVARAGAARNATRLSEALGRNPSPADLYIAHVLGSGRATAFLKVASEKPDTPLKEAHPALLSSLAHPNGVAASAMTVGDFYRRLCATLREPPRLVAIGLKPSVPDAPGRADLDWQANVEIAKVDRPLR